MKTLVNFFKWRSEWVKEYWGHYPCGNVIYQWPPFFTCPQRYSFCNINFQLLSLNRWNLFPHHLDLSSTRWLTLAKRVLQKWQCDHFKPRPQEALHRAKIFVPVVLAKAYLYRLTASQSQTHVWDHKCLLWNATEVAWLFFMQHYYGNRLIISPCRVKDDPLLTIGNKLRVCLSEGKQDFGILQRYGL